MKDEGLETGDRRLARNERRETRRVWAGKQVDRVVRRMLIEKNVNTGSERFVID
jgi:hypothetical protein